MTPALEGEIIKEVQRVIRRLTASSENADLETFLSFYDHSGFFLHISADGVRRKYADLKDICAEYYNSLERQKITTVEEDFQVLEEGLVLSSWTGDIAARFKNGDLWKMGSYSVTYVLKKIEGDWKIIRAHESALQPEIIKKE